MSKRIEQRATLKRETAGRLGRLEAAFRHVADRFRAGVGAARHRAEHLGHRSRRAIGRRS